MPLSHVLTEVQTVNVDNDAHASVFAPVVILPLVRPAAMRVLGLRHASVRVDEVPAQRHGMRVLSEL